MDTALLFTGVILNDGDSFSAICIDTDIASDGISADEAKRNLIEAVNLYIESALENNLPIIRPVPSGENPLHSNLPNFYTPSEFLVLILEAQYPAAQYLSWGFYRQFRYCS